MAAILSRPQWVNDAQYKMDFNTLRPIQNSPYFSDDIFKYIFLNENVWNSTEILL